MNAAEKSSKASMMRPNDSEKGGEKDVEAPSSFAEQRRKIVTQHDSMDTNDEFLVSAREREEFQKLLAKNGGDSAELFKQLRDDIDKQRAADIEKENLRMNREIAYKRTLEKELEEMRDRLSYATKEVYTIKNDITPEVS